MPNPASAEDPLDPAGPIETTVDACAVPPRTSAEDVATTVVRVQNVVPPASVEDVQTIAAEA